MHWGLSCSFWAHQQHLFHTYLDWSIKEIKWLSLQKGSKYIIGANKDVYQSLKLFLGLLFLLYLEVLSQVGHVQRYHFASWDKWLITEDGIFVYNEDVFSFCEFHDQTFEAVSADLDRMEVGSYFTESNDSYLQVNLNCLMMLATFLQVIRSYLPFYWCWLKIKKVSLSKSTASSHMDISHKFCRVFLINFLFGISCWTILDHAW